MFGWACWSLMRGLAYEPICCIRLCVLGALGAWRATAGFWVFLGILRQSNVFGFALVGAVLVGFRPCRDCDQPESLILAQNERWRHA